LFPDQPERVRELCHDVHNARAAGIPKGTDQATSNGWKWAMTFCVSTGMSIMRPRTLVTNLELLREAYFFAALFMFIACNIAPRTSRSAAAPAQGKPQSALNAVYGYRRALSMCSCQLVDMRMISSILKGLNAQFKATWGKDALVPEHRRAFSLAQLRAMVRLLDTRAIFSWSDDMHVALRSAYLYGLHTGARLNEMVNPASYKRRSEIEMIDGGQVIPATPENIARFSNGMLLRIRPDCSKADRFNISWGNREMHFAMDDTNVLNFPAAWKRFELQFPCALAERASLAAFSPHGSRSPFAEHELRSAFILLMVTAFGATVAAVHSWHALRITLACALLAGGQCDGTIQAVCRWKSIDSLRVYAEMTASTYASTAALVTTTDASKYATSTLPTTGPEDVAADIDDAITLINGDAPPRTRATSAPARSSSPPPLADTTPPPPSTATQLRKGARVSVYWTDEGTWYSGTVTSSRKADEARITRVFYDAAPPHQAHAAWHNLEEERWALL
jgi:integrase